MFVWRDFKEDGKFKREKWRDSILVVVWSGRGREKKVVEPKCLLPTTFFSWWRVSTRLLFFFFTLLWSEMRNQNLNLILRSFKTFRSTFGGLDFLINAPRNHENVWFVLVISWFFLLFTWAFFRLLIQLEQKLVHIILKEIIIIIYLQ